MAHEWKEFFDAIGEAYDQEVFTSNTVAEVDFIIKELALEPGASILDVGCGTGRHAIELAGRGFAVTGIDISSAMLAVAKRKADEAGVKVDFREIAAQDFQPDKTFDAALSLCEGALCLFSDTDDLWSKDMAVFANMAGSLKPEGKFLVTVLNAFALVRSTSDEKVSEGIVDLFTLTSRFENKCAVNGKEVTVRGIERYYTPSEIVRMVNRIGMKVDHVYGGTAGNWCRGKVLLDEIEFMVIGHRKK